MLFFEYLSKFETTNEWILKGAILRNMDSSSEIEPMLEIGRFNW